MASVDINLGSGPVRTISFDELLSVGLASLNGEDIEVYFHKNDNFEYKLLLKHLGKLGYRATDHGTCYADGETATVVFVKEDRDSARKQALENQISVLEKEFGVVICYKKK